MVEGPRVPAQSLEFAAVWGSGQRAGFGSRQTRVGVPGLSFRTLRKSHGHADPRSPHLKQGALLRVNCADLGKRL